MNKRAVEFDSKGVTLRADLVLPDQGEGPFPIVVMGGGWCYVKEIVMPHYAKAILEAGAAVLMFDYRNVGASDGEPRQHLDPWGQIEDYKNAITYVSSIDEIDKDRIGVWGISYAGGHALIVGATDDRVKCVVSNIPVVDGFENMRRVHGSTRFNDLLALMRSDREERTISGGAGGKMPMSTTEPHKELSTWPFGSVYEVFNKIKNSEAPLHEHWSTIESTELLLNYSVFPFTSRIYNTPVMMVVAEGDEITLWDMEMKAFESIPSPNKELVVVPKVSHMSLYSQQSHLEKAGRSAARFVKTHLVES